MQFTNFGELMVRRLQAGESALDVASLADWDDAAVDDEPAAEESLDERRRAGIPASSECPRSCMSVSEPDAVSEPSASRRGAPSRRSCSRRPNRSRPACSRSSSSSRSRGSRRCATSSAREYEESGRGFVLAAGRRRLPLPDPPRSLAPTSSASCSRASTPACRGPALETLAIIAYKQPISRGQMSAIRGVNVEATLTTLLQRGYVQEVGRDPGPGAAVLYGTTARVPRAARPRLARRPAAARRLRARPVGGRGARARPAHQRRPAASRRAGRRRGRGGADATPRPTDAVMPERPDGERLQKVLARAGLGSRRVCEELIADGPRHRQRRASRCSGAGSTSTPTRSRSTASPWSCATTSCTTCSTSPPGT